VNSLPLGLSLNVGSGPYVARRWISLDGSWQILFAGTALAKLAAIVTGREVGHWPRGIWHRDVRKGLPFSDESVSIVYSSHFLEHLHRDEATAFLRDAHRVLKPAGVCRVVVPDLAAAVREYFDGLRGARAGNSDRLMEALDMRHREAPARGPLAWYRRLTDFSTHKWLYDVEGLVGLFAEGGFRSAKPCAFLESAIPTEHLRAVEQESRLANGAGICVEARK
jgi:predicted SAM-dependent methyltransferase